MKKITTIVFDLGGVLVKEKESEINLGICKFINVDLKKFKTVSNRWKRDVTVGSITLKELYERVLAELNIDIFSSKTITQKHINLYKKYSTERDQKILDLIKSLKNKYTIVALTNTEIEIADLNKKNGLFTPFYKTYISADLRMMKPDLKIYKYVLDDLRIKPEETIFIDDKQKYIDTAYEIGINCVLYDNYDQLKRALNNLSIKLSDKT